MCYAQLNRPVLIFLLRERISIGLVNWIKNRRRKSMKTMKKLMVLILVAAVFCLVASAAFCGGEKAAKTIRALAWSGYLEKDWVLDFEEENNCNFEITFIGSADEEWAKAMSSEGAYEIIIIDSSVIPRYYRAGLIQAIDLSMIKNLGNINPNIPFEQYADFGGERYGIPYTWGSSPMAYNADVIKSRPRSWGVLWDPKYKGQVSIRDDIYITWAMVGAYLGVSDPWNPTSEENQEIEQKLRELHKNILTYYTGTTEGANLMASGEVVVMYAEATNQIHEARSKGANIQESIPDEGSPTWLDNLCIGSNAENIDLVHKFIDLAITPEWQGRIGETVGYGVAVPDAMKFMSDEMIELTHMDDPDYWKLLFLFEPVPDEEYERRLTVWNNIKAGM
jgi:spermidine/putrescine transport system substrate-binding protein